MSAVNTTCSPSAEIRGSSGASKLPGRVSSVVVASAAPSYDTPLRLVSSSTTKARFVSALLLQKAVVGTGGAGVDVQNVTCDPSPEMSGSHAAVPGCAETTCRDGVPVRSPLPSTGPRSITTTEADLTGGTVPKAMKEPNAMYLPSPEMLGVKLESAETVVAPG